MSASCIPAPFPAGTISQAEFDERFAHVQTLMRFLDTSSVEHFEACKDFIRRGVSTRYPGGVEHLLRDPDTPLHDIWQPQQAAILFTGPFTSWFANGPAGDATLRRLRELFLVYIDIGDIRLDEHLVRRRSRAAESSQLVLSWSSPMLRAVNYSGFDYKMLCELARRGAHHHQDWHDVGALPKVVPAELKKLPQSEAFLQVVQVLRSPTPECAPLLRAAVTHADMARRISVSRDAAQPPPAAGIRRRRATL